MIDVTKGQGLGFAGCKITLAKYIKLKNGKERVKIINLKLISPILVGKPVIKVSKREKTEITLVIKEIFFQGTEFAISDGESTFLVNIVPWLYKWSV